MANKLIKKYKKDFTIIANKIFFDKQLKYKELGILNQLLSLPNNWDFNIKGLASIHGDGEDSVKSGLVKLENLGYLTRIRKRELTGQLSSSDYLVYDDPKDNEYFDRYDTYPIIINSKGEIENKPKNKGLSPRGENPLVVKPLVDNQDNKEYIDKELINSTSTNTDFAEQFQMSEIRTSENNDTKHQSQTYQNDMCKFEYVVDDLVLIDEKQYSDLNDLVKMCSTHELASTKTKLINFVKKLYKKDKKVFCVGNEVIIDLKAFVVSQFNKQSDHYKEENEAIKKMAEDGNDWAIEEVKKHPERFKNFN